MSRIDNLHRRHKRFNADEVTYPLWVSDAKKRANDKALAKDFMDYFDDANEIDEERCRKLQENYELHAGRWKNIETINPAMTITLGHENVVLGSGRLHHYPIIDRVSKSVVSDLIMRPLIPVIKDNSSKARNHRERIRLDRVKAYFQNTVIQPALAQITAQYDQQNGINDVISLPIEAQRQREFDIQRRFRQETPEEIFTYLEKLSTPDEMVAEALLKEGLRYVKAKSKFDVGAENAVITAEEYYRLDIINGMPHMEALNPKWVIWGGSEHTEFVEDGQFAKYVQYLTPEDALTKYAYHLVKSDIKRLSNLYSEIPGYSYDEKRNRSSRGIERKIVDIFADNPELQNEINVRTREGQDKLRHLYSTLSHSSRDGFGIRESYITWRWMRRVKFVTRLINGQREMFIRDEHYKKDPFAGDIEVVEKVIPQTWGGKKLGEEFYIDVNPIPYQYNNINDPFDVKLGIYGGIYNTFQNNVRNASLIDLGKPWQYKYNVLMKKMEEHQATDIGKVFLGTTTMIPKGWTWAQWYKSLFLAKTAVVSNHREGINNLDTTIFRSIDLSRTLDIENDLRQLEYFENKIITAMYYSPQKIGDVSQYATNRNTQVALAGVDRQMFRFHNRNRQIKENVLNSFLQLCLYAYKDNEDVKSTVLDDFLKAHYELNFNSTEFSNFSLTGVDDFRESEKLQELKNLALTFLQNGMTGRDLIAIIDGESMDEIRQVIEDIEMKKQKLSEEEFQRQESLLEKQRQSAEMQLRMQQEFDALQKERENQVKIRMAEINSLQLQNAADVDRDKINDSLERTMLDIQSKEKIKQMELRHDEKIKNKQFEIERSKVKKQQS